MENQLKYVDNNVAATIDNETQHINVYEIIKFRTYFTLNNNINTILEKPIDINLFLKYINGNNESELIPKGYVDIIITDISNKNILLKTTSNFNNGKIETQIKNNLPIGTYILTIKYPGNKYYEEKTISFQFLISHKTAKCIFEKDFYEEYPNKIFNINMRLLDVYTNKKISNCTINYSFNNFDYITKTDENGFANLIINTPDIDPSKCTNNFKYPLKVYIDDSSYRLSSETSIDVYIKKYKTSIIYTSSIDNDTIKIIGDIYGYDDDEKIVNVEYGTVDFDILNINKQISTDVDTNGHFNLDIPIDLTENANIEPQELENYSVPQTTKIEVDLPNGTTMTRNYVKKNRIKIVANVTSKDKPVPYGMVSFIISQENKEIYRYVSELDMEGTCVFHFDVSTIGSYQIRAEYHSIFEYQSSISETKKYTIEDE